MQVPCSGPDFLGSGPPQQGERIVAKRWPGAVSRTNSPLGDIVYELRKEETTMRFRHIDWTFSDTAEVVIASLLAVVMVAVLFA